MCARAVANRGPRIRHRGYRDGATFTPMPGQLEQISRAETVEMLQMVPLFSGLSKRQLAAVAKVVGHLSVGPGAVLVKEQDFGSRLVIVRKGTAEVRRQGDSGSNGAAGAAKGRRLATVGPR